MKAHPGNFVDNLNWLTVFYSRPIHVFFESAHSAVWFGARRHQIFFLR